MLTQGGVLFIQVFSTVNVGTKFWDFTLVSCPIYYTTTRELRVATDTL